MLYFIIQIPTFLACQLSVKQLHACNSCTLKLHTLYRWMCKTSTCISVYCTALRCMAGCNTTAINTGAVYYLGTASLNWLRKFKSSLAHRTKSISPADWAFSILRSSSHITAHYQVLHSLSLHFILDRIDGEDSEGKWVWSSHSKSLHRQ